MHAFHCRYLLQNIFVFVATCLLYTVQTTEWLKLAFDAQLLHLLLLVIVRTGAFLFRFPKFILKIPECYFHWAKICSFHLCFILYSNICAN